MVMMVRSCLLAFIATTCLADLMSKEDLQGRSPMSQEGGDCFLWAFLFSLSILTFHIVENISYGDKI